MSNKKTGRVAELARALGANEAWAGSVLGRLCVDVDADGWFDFEEARQAIDRAARFQGNAAIQSSVVSAEMGPTEETCRLWLKSHFEQNGLEVVGRAKRRGSRMTLRKPDGTEFFILTYVALRTKSNGQIGFTINYMDDPGLDWIGFIAKPWGKAYLRRRKEILERMRIEPGKEPKTANITFSPKADNYLLENRIQELIEA